MFSLRKIFGDVSARTLKKIRPMVGRINALEGDFESLSAEALRAKTSEFRSRLGGGATLDTLLPEAFAAVREAAKRTLKQRHFDVQLMGGMVLHRGAIAEMRTGEGKTLVATLPAYLNALVGKGVHVITVNDYLARRDAVWMGQVYEALGMSVGVINHESSFRYDPAHTEVDAARDETGSFKVFHQFLRPCSRREAYEADITYGTNNEYGFDYLRDNLEYSAKDLRQREHHFAIVDEIDSILIDEARTPLIISAPTTDSESLYVTFAAIARKFEKDVDFRVDEKFRAVHLTDAGIEKAQQLLGIENIYTDRGVKYVHHLEIAVKAKALYEKDKEYVIRDGEVVIVDEFTGRLMPGRRWGEGLHQAVEAKEGVSIQKESRTYASITFQNYFRQYKKLAGMTGTALTSAEEFLTVYRLDTIEVPPNRPSARTDHNDLIFQTEHGKFTAAARRVKELHASGQPVLVGTASIEKNELLSGYLTREGIPHEVLNAKNHEREGEIIAQAGRRGKVTIATNLAGRGVDIKLGGNPATPEEYEEIKNVGGLFVLGTERHEARRIDNQLRGRAGRQGDPGATQFYVSMEDTLMRVFAAETVKSMMNRLGLPEDQPIENRLITRSLESAQKKIEGFNFDSRKQVLEYDNVLNIQRTAIYERRRRILLADADGVLEELEAIVDTRPEIAAIATKKQEELGKEEFANTLRRLMLQAIDMLWVEHLEVMEYARGSVNLRAYGQRDPLIEYRKEGMRLFRQMQDSVDETIANLIPGIGAGAFKAVQQEMREVHEQARAIGEKTAGSAAPAGVSRKGEVGRNDPCPCGSGKKYKQCGLKNTEEHQRHLTQRQKTTV